MEIQPSSTSRPLFLIGEQEMTLDAKSRLLVPAEFRKEIMEARNEKRLICRIGSNRLPWLYPENYYRELIAQRRATLTPGQSEEAFNEAYYGMVVPLEWDAQGRVGLPDKLLKRTNLGKQVTIVGSGDHLVIWNTDDWERRTGTLIEQMADIEAKAGQTMPPAGPTQANV